jgi:hypothetical protein
LSYFRGGRRSEPAASVVDDTALAFVSNNEAEVFDEPETITASAKKSHYSVWDPLGAAL